ncbi:response regulator transcription factor [Exilibacterium tricleocarpae]|uniref:Response regulator transcription factor n=1 Tax=Exilibacterium tricleocarpae TaxID=2591008 RepID=A0A545T659_9GAMM|nr:response regulator transcription factor [Exilibacterium tricleocarpae]TQV72709.1 response regulator transcription factor [Exilibacterium tricleocarpae]
MRGSTVLIVEDDSALLRGLKDNFAAKDYDVHTAMEGEAGLRLAFTLKPDLIILDIMLPMRNGFDICRRVREAGLDMPIIMLTAKGCEGDVIRGLNLGADDYVTKPFSVRELLARANAFLRRHRKPAADIVRFDDFEFNLTSRKLTQGDQYIPLTPKEHGLLELFVRRPGRSLTRDTILTVVWHNKLLITPRSVDRCVNTLRQKIEPDSRLPRYIKSVRDVGYRFDMPVEERSV